MQLIRQNITTYKMNSVFFRIFFSIMGIVLISVLIVTSISYRYSKNMMVSEVKSNNMLVLKQIQQSVDREVKAIASSAMQISLDKRLIKALYVPRKDSYMEGELYRDIIAYLSSVKANNEYISNLWVYFNNSDIVVGSEGKYDSELFFNSVCKYSPGIQWKEVSQKFSGFRSMGRQEVEYDLARVPVIVFVKSLPVNEYNPKGILVVCLNEQFFYKKMGDHIEGKFVWNYIIDSDNNIIFTNEKSYKDSTDKKQIRSVLFNNLDRMDSDLGTFDTKLDGEFFTVQYIKSEVNDWSYISVTPTGYIVEKVNNIRNVSLWVTAMSMILSIIITYLLVKRLYRPINDILNYISIVNNEKLDKQKAESVDELRFINKIIDYVYKENESLRDSYNKSYPMLREKFLNDVIDGKVTQQRYREIGNNIGIDMSYQLFQVIVFEIDEYETQTITNYKVLNFDKKLDEIAMKTLNYKAKCFSLQRDKKTLVSIINADENFYESEGINEYLNEVRDYFRSSYSLTFTIGVGRHYYSIDECSISFVEAMHSLKYKIVKGHDTVIYIDEVRNNSGNFFDYSIEKEKQLVTILKSGDIISANRILLEVLTDNLGKRSITPEMINNFFNSLVSTAIRAIYEMQATITRIFGQEIDIYAEMAKKDLVEEKKTYIYFIFRSIAVYADEHRQYSKNTKVYEKIKAYVEENYNKELSLDKVAEVADLSPSYLSYLFKEISGMNFVDYINKYRSEKAKELLSSTTMTVAQVAEAVGYINSNTFSKTFKKYIGVSPGRYRDIL